jgi:hypothetical protein
VTRVPSADPAAERTVMFIIAQAADRGGLTLAEVLRDIPHDTAAFVVYALLAIFVGLIWAGSRKKPT